MRRKFPLKIKKGKSAKVLKINVLKKEDGVVHIPARKTSYGKKKRIAAQMYPVRVGASQFNMWDFAKQSLIHLTIIALIAGINWFGLSTIGQTLASYNDTETSGANVFTAGMLDIILSNTEFEGVIGNDSGDASQFETNVSLIAGSLPAQYTVEYEKTGGNDSMCDVLALDSTHTTLSYTGALSAFSVGTTTDFGFWSFVITVPSGQSVSAGETCEFDFIYKARGEDALSWEASGFNDEERFHILIEAVEAQSPVVINEFLPNPDGVLCTDGSDNCDEGDPEFIFDFGKDSDDKPQGEWIELYNLTGNPVDLTDWYIQDASGGIGNIGITNLNTLPATTTISAHSFLVIYMNKAVLNNTGDVVKLFNASDILQDSYAYTSEYDYCYLTPTPGGTNDETPSGGGIDCTSGSNIPGNKSYARMPDGTGLFIDPLPTPGNRNSLDDANAPKLFDGLFLLESEEAPELSIEGNTSPAPTEKIEIIKSDPLASSTEPVFQATEEDAGNIFVSEELGENVVSEADDLADEGEDQHTEVPQAIIPDDVEEDENAVKDTTDEPPHNDEGATETAPEETPIEEPVAETI